MCHHVPLMSNSRTPAEFKNCKLENPLGSDMQRVLSPCVTNELSRYIILSLQFFRVRNCSLSVFSFMIASLTQPICFLSSQYRAALSNPARRLILCSQPVLAKFVRNLCKNQVKDKT